MSILSEDEARKFWSEQSPHDKRMLAKTAPPVAGPKVDLSEYTFKLADDCVWVRTEEEAVGYVTAETKTHAELPEIVVQICLDMLGRQKSYLNA